MRRIGVLMNLAASDAEGQARIAALLQGLERLGWVPGRNVRIDTRWAAGRPDNFRAYARELLALEPEVIVGVATPAVTALQQAVAAYRSCSSASRRTGGGWRRAPCSTFRACAHGTGPRALRQCARKSGRAMVDSRVESKLTADVGALVSPPATPTARPSSSTWRASAFICRRAAPSKRCSVRLRSA